jgi:hypothetical protein
MKENNDYEKTWQEMARASLKKDLPEFDPAAKREPIARKDTLAERMYRKGYQHGYSASIDAFKGIPDKRLFIRVINFFNSQITPWRYKDHKGEIEIPPTFKR